MGIFAALSLMMAGCSNSDNADIEGKADTPVDQLYNDALNTVLAGDVDLAAPKFEEVERQHPYSIWAVRAQIMAAWSFYQSINMPRPKPASTGSLNYIRPIRLPNMPII